MPNSNDSVDTVVILAAAGSASRFRSSATDAHQQSKVFVAIEGIPIWQYSVLAFRKLLRVGSIYMTVSADDLPNLEKEFDTFLTDNDVQLVTGGAERWLSVKNALLVISQEHEHALETLVAVHDAARPCVAVQSIAKVLDLAKHSGAALLGQPLWGTIKRTDSDARVIETVSRENLYQASTPQAFRLDWLLQAYSDENIARSRESGSITDDAQLVAMAGRDVKMCPDTASNIKITTYEDLELAKFFLGKA